MSDQRTAKRSDVLERAYDMLGYIFLLNRPLTKSELKKIEELQIEIGCVLANERRVFLMGEFEKSPTNPSNSHQVDATHCLFLGFEESSHE
jgi:hypothetical protein